MALAHGKTAVAAGYSAEGVSVPRTPILRAKQNIPRYSCSRAWMDNGSPHCIAFGGLRVNDAIEEALLGVVGPVAIAAATAAAKEAGERRDQVRGAISRELEAPRMRPTGPSVAADPANRLLASELKRICIRHWTRWRGLF